MSVCLIRVETHIACTVNVESEMKPNSYAPDYSNRAETQIIYTVMFRQQWNSNHMTVMQFSDQNFVSFQFHYLKMHSHTVERYHNNFAWHINHLIWNINDNNLKFPVKNFVWFQAHYLLLKIQDDASSQF